MPQLANELCFCGSGKRYKKCHKPLHRTPPGRYLEAARKFYSRRWIASAAAHQRGKDYDWMIDQVPGSANRILDIGVGEGSGLVTMLQRRSPDKIVALEENPEIVHHALQTIRTAGTTVDVVNRMTTEQVMEGSPKYKLSFTGEMVSSDCAVTIVVTDPIFDKKLATDLVGDGQFDLVTVWLMGSHEAREHSQEMDAFGHMTAAKYRLIAQNTAYELADKVLAVGGHLQIVDRLQLQEIETMIALLMQSHSEQAEPTTLEVKQITYREYQEAKEGGIKMLLQDDAQGTVVSGDSNLLLASIVSVKR